LVLFISFLSSSSSSSSSFFFFFFNNYEEKRYIKQQTQKYGIFFIAKRRVPSMENQRGDGEKAKDLTRAKNETDGSIMHAAHAGMGGS
jgi:hypothetical protein